MRWRMAMAKPNYIQISTPVVKQLQEAGFLPSECARVKLIMPPHGPMLLRFDVFMTEARLRQLGGAFLALAEERTKLTDEPPADDPDA